MMAPATVHATAVATPDGRRCVLLLGASGAGKSDLALRLLDRGWRLVADDRVVLATSPTGRLTAGAPPPLAGLLEVRGVGILPAKAVAGPVDIALVLDLAAAPERLPEPGAWQASGLRHHPIPLLALAPFAASAVLKVERALQGHGLAVEAARMPTPRQPESPPPSSRLPLLAVSALSGAGTSTALTALEALGYEVVDYLPLALVDALIAAPASTDPRPLAFGIDARTRAFDAEALVVRLRALKHTGTDIGLLYLEGADDALVRRFSDTRRRHPLALDRPAAAGTGRERHLTAPLKRWAALVIDTSALSVSDPRRRHPLAIDRPAADAIGLERHLTEPLKRWADLVIDTSDLSVSDLRRRIAEQLGQADRAGLTITLQSFGFAHGLPRNADLVFDMRFLANPHWDMALRPLTGEDARVATHVKADPAYAPAVDRIADLLATLIPGYGREGKAYLTIAIGCTGGRHRSVTVARDLQARLAALGHATTLDHRDMKQAGADAADLAAEPFTTPGADESLTAPPAPVQRAGQ
ncbi:hypothetical protein GCM10007973_04420 [Polymorphobacter multimanifer]|uniref:RNase adapter RapZ n=1 Tax=Polymorphobacter multimanifer TaxID=1070431 RepID=UPI00166DE263|nr:RNase adapter RapZ [Polymorphobacter multimanifer]GGI70564.1 hypothetical protein GCM10007973_04420 [Polymorphobacter multimanifer]